MNRTAFLQGHLDRVSRSFSFCIASLEGDLRVWVSLSYLLCRMLDTVEDAVWATSGSQDAAFDSFRKFVESMPEEDEVRSWADSFPDKIPGGEKLLVQEAFEIFREFHSLPVSVREKIRKPVLNMYRGMRFFLRERRMAGSLRLRTLHEVNQYCFFVAGLVGELLTDLVGERWPALVSPKTYLDAHHFGLFLQKINLLKDQAGDEREGRYLVPSRRELLASLSRDAEGAIRYLQTLPVAEKGFRLFCAWSLFLGLASLPWIERSRLLGVFQKIPRVFTEQLLRSVSAVIDDNQALLKLFRDLLPALPTLSLSSGPVLSLHWMGEIYDGALGEAEFAALGLLPSR